MRSRRIETWRKAWMSSEQRGVKGHDAEVGPAELEKGSGALRGGVHVRKTDGIEGVKDLLDRNAAGASAGGEEAASRGADGVPSGKGTA